MRTLSASQLEKLTQCERRWAFIYLEGKREPNTDAAQAGTKVHELLEAYVQHRTPIDDKLTWKSFAIGAIAKDMSQHAPPPDSGAETELKLELEAEGFTYTGRVDLRLPGEVWDWKTTSNLKRAKDVDALADDVQALIYAKWLGTDGYLQWTTGQTKGAVKTVKHRLKVLKTDIDQKFSEIVTPLARRAEELYAGAEPKKNFKACFLYPPIGCPFLSLCKPTNSEKITFMSEGTGKLSLMEKMRLAKEAKGQDLINPPDVVVPPAAAQEPELPKKPRKKKADTAAEVLVEHGVVLKQPVRPELPAGAGDVVPMAEVVPATALLQDATGTPTPVQPLDGKPIDTLYLNCMPCFTVDRLLHGFDLIRIAARTVCDDVELFHVRLAEFGKGDAMLAAQLEADIMKLEPGFSVVLQSRTPEGRGVEQTLCALAKRVVLGT